MSRGSRGSHLRFQTEQLGERRRCSCATSALWSYRGCESVCGNQACANSQFAPPPPPPPPPSPPAPHQLNGFSTFQLQHPPAVKANKAREEKFPRGAGRRRLLIQESCSSHRPERSCRRLREFCSFSPQTPTKTHPKKQQMYQRLCVLGWKCVCVCLLICPDGVSLCFHGRITCHAVSKGAAVGAAG